jgi:hypothetical protein
MIDSIVGIMYHACPPTQGESCGWDGGVLSHLSDSQWNDLVTDGGELNAIWKGRRDIISPFLQQLKVGERARLPRPWELDSQPGWTFFMSWSELTFSDNAGQDIADLYASPWVLTLDEMPGWD